MKSAASHPTVDCGSRVSELFTDPSFCFSYFPSCVSLACRDPSATSKAPTKPNSTLYSNMVDVLNKLLFAQKSNNRTALRFRSGRSFSPIIPHASRSYYHCLCDYWKLRVKQLSHQMGHPRAPHLVTPKSSGTLNCPWPKGARKKPSPRAKTPMDMQQIKGIQEYSCVCLFFLNVLLNRFCRWRMTHVYQ